MPPHNYGLQFYVENFAKFHGPIPWVSLQNSAVHRSKIVQILQHTAALRL